MQRKHFKKLVVGGALLASLGLVTGCEETGAKVSPDETEFVEIFESVDVTVDAKNHEITLSGAVDSLVVGSLEALGGSKYFIATDDDPVDPSFDWDEELKEGSVIKFGDNNEVRIVVLDDENRTIAVWTVSFPEEKSSSSKDKSSSSFSEAADDEVSSSSAEEEDESSSSEEPVEESSNSEETVESSSSEEVVESSSSVAVEESSSSEEPVEESSSSEEIVESSSSSEESVESSSSEEVVESSSSEEMVESSSSAANEPQLPGSSFDSWDKTFWGSTSDAMAKDEWNTAIHLYSGANLKENGSSITLTSQVVYGSAVGQKLAGGFYFTGEYTGTTCDDIYNADGGYPGLESSNLTKKMNFGRPFTARPKSFDVTYAYNHVAGRDKSHPQMDLIYVMLVSADNKVVASGMITDTESVALTTKRVELQYGYAPEKLLDGTFAVQRGMVLGDGTEEVATIHVMFASSAHAHVAANGSSNWRGGEGSQLTIDEFKLNY